MHPCNHSKLRFRRAFVGFSLVEVTIALGIAALAITVILGLVPTGLNSLREAGNTAAESSIMRQMLSELQAADWGTASGGSPGWSKLSAYAAQKRHFDDQGTAVEEGSNEFVSYVARFGFPNNPVILSGGAAGPDMIYVRVDVAVTPNKNYGFDDPKSYASRTWIVARQY
jgi:uncharacterized protein (TIGR02598 family)